MTDRDYPGDSIMPETAITMTPVPPFSFDLTASNATYFREQYGTDRYIDGIFQQLLDIEDRRCLISVCSPGAVYSPKMDDAGPVVASLKGAPLHLRAVI